ncbi:MAG TPA: efflux RND transporter periplasmic adaptor subunit, partial [Terriglobales bacterium]|nr:efflux RND transporter periplasmic adaptor subunit [Terriglobales bacterium]
MNQAKRFAVLIAVIVVVAVGYYFLSVDSPKDLELVGTVDANQVIVSAKITGRIEKLYVDEGSQVKQGDLIAQLDTAELQAQTQSAAAAEATMRHKVLESSANEQLAKGTTSNDVRNAEAMLQSARSALAQARADMVNLAANAKRIDGLADAGVASQQDRDLADSNYNSQKAKIRSLQDQVRASEAALASTRARTYQAQAAQMTVEESRAQQKQADFDRQQAEARLGYTKIYAPVSGTVSIRVAREGEVVNPGQAIVTIVDFTETWVRAPLPETYADNIGIGDTLKVRLPGGDVVDG